MAPTEPPSSAFIGIIIGLVSSFGSIVLIALVIFIFWASGCAGSGRIILDRLGRPGEYDDEQAFAREEAEALETMDDMTRTEYLRAKAFVTANPPESLPTDISLSQYLAIQEKGVSAWEFEPELEVANCFVEARTEIEFFDSECTVMSNLPIPKQNEVYYWEAKIYEKPDNTLLSIGVGTKPYPLFRLPGYHKYSVAYFSDGSRHYNQPFSSTPYAPRLVQGDVVGVGYRPRTGAVFFTRNGKRYDEVVHGLKSQNFFPAIGATGPAIVHVNLGQSGFVFIEANVKKWGLAPATGSLAPPPPYGSEQGSILLESGSKDGMVSGQRRPPHLQPSSDAAFTGGRDAPYMVGRDSHYMVGRDSPYVVGRTSNTFLPSHGRTHSGTFRSLPPTTSPGPVRSPTDISLAQLVPTDEGAEASGSAAGNNGHQEEAYRDGNPLHLHLEDATNPPPEYASPTLSASASSVEDDHERPRADNEETPLMEVTNRSRGGSSATATPRRGKPADEQPPVPSYSDAVRDGAGLQERTDRDSDGEAVSDEEAESSDDASLSEASS
ncbi:Rsp5p-dependent ubiquitination, sorting of cargo proteins at the multivesicular body [Claviceps purpurea]|nr:Rsp5p-dependent ubiquitination, sorting of cargo proteins at the multivesicular body [Claviceps purpurea]